MVNTSQSEGDSRLGKHPRSPTTETARSLSVKRICVEETEEPESASHHPSHTPPPYCNTSRDQPAPTKQDAKRSKMSLQNILCQDGPQQTDAAREPQTAPRTRSKEPTSPSRPAAYSPPTRIKCEVPPLSDLSAAWYSDESAASSRPVEARDVSGPERLSFTQTLAETTVPTPSSCLDGAGPGAADKLMTPEEKIVVDTMAKEDKKKPLPYSKKLEMIFGLRNSELRLAEHEQEHANLSVFTC